MKTNSTREEGQDKGNKTISEGTEFSGQKSTEWQPLVRKSVFLQRYKRKLQT
jgi:hypothetical protein